MDRRLLVGVLTLACVVLTPAVASAESISGTVTGPADQPLEGVCVAAFDPVDDTIGTGLRGFTGTLANGTYTIGLPAGAASYKVVFSTGNDGGCGVSTTPVVTEWYDDKGTHAAADPVPVGAGANVTGINAKLAFPTPTTGSISGTVTHGGGAGFGGVCVAALDSANALMIVGNPGTTGPDGTYTVTNVPAGSYKLIFTTDSPCPDGSSFEAVTEYYNDKASHALGDAVVVTNGNTTANINAVLETLARADDDAFAVTQDSGANQLNVLANDDEADVGQTIEMTNVTDPPHGTAVIDQGAPDLADYAPDAGYCGADSFTYTVNGGDTATVSITIDCFPTAVNDGPVTLDRNSGANTINVLANDLNADGGPMLVVAKLDGLKGTVAITNAGANVSYTPNQNACGADSFDYGLNGGSVGTVSVTINCPVATDDSATVGEDSGANAVDVLANDTGTPRSVASKTNGTNGSVAITGAGTGVSYTPNADFCGSDSFTYSLNAPPNPAAPATVNVTVTCVDDSPVAASDSATVAEDGAPSTINVLANDTDVDGGAAKTIASKTNGANGAVVITSGGNDLSYAPNANYCGADSFTYTLNGGSVGTVNVTVTCVDDTPAAVADSATVAEDSGSSTIEVLANDTDVDGGAKTVASATNGSHGTVAILAGGLGVGFTPTANYCGSDSFTYTLNGGSVGTVTVTVTCVDDAPTAVNDAMTVAEDAVATAVDVLANDTDSDGGTRTIASTTDAPHGTVAITGSGAGVTYRPDANYCGPDSFTYVLTGGSTGTVAMTVTCVEDPVADTVAPATTITKGPKAKVTTRRAKVRVKFAFKSSEAGSKFRCKLDKGAFRACASPKSYKVKRGRHTFRVFATDASGNVDPTPAKRKFKVVRRR